MADSPDLSSRRTVSIDLSAIPLEALCAEWERRGFDVENMDVVTDDGVDLDRLADAIAAGETDAALDLLHELVPGAPRPATVRHLREIRAAQPAFRFSS